MPAPTKVWGQAATYNDQPDDSFLDEGLHPELPWPTQFVNWTLNFIWGTLIGTEHDQFTGAHTNVTFDTLTANTNTPESVVLPALFEYKSAAPIVVKLVPSRWVCSENPYSLDPDALELSGPNGTDAKIAFYFDAAVSGASVSSDITLTSLALYAKRTQPVSPGAGIDWVLEYREAPGAHAWVSVASGNISAASLPPATDPPAVFDLGVSSTPLVSGREYRLTVQADASSSTNGAFVGSGAALFSRTNHYPG